MIIIIGELETSLIQQNAANDKEMDLSQQQQSGMIKGFADNEIILETVAGDSSQYERRKEGWDNTS